MANKNFGRFARTALAVAMLAGAQFAAAATTNSAAVTLNASENFIGNRSWQDIASTSYTWADNNGDGRVGVGEEVTFSVNMHKLYDGRHDFDALKFWFGDGTAAATAEWDDWTRVKSNTNLPDTKVNWTNTFTFKHTFQSATTFDIFASVTCDFDLSDLTPSKNVVTQADWDAWTTEYHKGKNNNRQGETEHYTFTVTAVPEPETYAMMLAGLGLMGTIARRRKIKTA
jgi:hypothetical protein